MERSILHDHFRAEKAELSRGDPPLVLAFGEVPEEHRAGREGCGLLDQTDRGLVSVRGRDAADFLHRLLANRIRDLEPGQGNRNLLLSPKGKVLFDFELAREDEGFRLSTPPGAAAALAAALDTYLFAEKVELADLSAEHAPLALLGPRAPDVIRAVLSIEPPRGGSHQTVAGTLAGSPLRVTALLVAGSPGWRVDGGPGLALPLWLSLREAGATPIGRVAYDSLRVEAGAAEPGIDVDENVYPQEARLEDALSLEKGCYVGQEVVAKIDTYGGLNKRLTGLSVAHDDPVSRGTRLLGDEGGEPRELGLVTSWAYSFALNTGMVLAYVKRRHQEPGTTFRLREGERDLGEATVVELPFRP